MSNEIVKGRSLGSFLDKRIESMTTESRSRADIVESIGSAAGISSSTVNQILNGSINCPPLSRLRGFARALNVSMNSLTSAAEGDGCNYDEQKSCPHCSTKNMTTGDDQVEKQLAPALDRLQKKLDTASDAVQTRINKA